MSTQTPPPAGTNGHKRSGVRTYRGRKLEDLIPQIRAELGPEAIILRQRDGLMGGVGGFFAQKCVEVDAAPAPQVDLYDEEPEEVAEVTVPPAVPEVAEVTVPPAVPEAAAVDAPPAPAPADEEAVFQSFATRLEQAATQVGDVGQLAAAASVAPAPAPAPPPRPAAPPWVRKRDQADAAGEAEASERELTGQGISPEWAHVLVVAAAAHRSPLTPHGSLRDAIRATLAATIPAPAPLPSAGAAVAFVGPGGVGKTHCAAALAAAYASGSSLTASVVSLGARDWGAEVKELLKLENVWVTVAPEATDAHAAVAGGRDGGLVVIDTPAVSPADRVGVAQLTADLQSLGVDAIYIVVPATFSVRAARKLVGALEALGADGIAITHADGADQLGVAAELAYESGMPVAYVHQGAELHGSMSATDPASLAARLLP
jgi:flagellar biosynthesis GTPase FlhF